MESEVLSQPEQVDSSNDIDADVEARKRRTSNTISLMLRDAGRVYENRTLKSWEAPTQAQRDVKEAVTRWLLRYVDGERPGLVLYGPVGTGKDHLAFGAVAFTVSQCDLTARWKNGRELFSEARDAINHDRDESALLGTMKQPDVLILSDPLPALGDLTVSQADLLYRIVDDRQRSGKPTVITLNVSSDEEADRRIGAPTWDRLCDNAYKLACCWPSQRGPLYEIKPPGARQ